MPKGVYLWRPAPRTRVVAMEFRGSAEDIGMIVYAHPSLSGARKDAALGVDKRWLNI